MSRRGEKRQKSIRRNSARTRCYCMIYGRSKETTMESNNKERVVMPCIQPRLSQEENNSHSLCYEKIISTRRNKLYPSRMTKSISLYPTFTLRERCRHHVSCTNRVSFRRDVLFIESIVHTSRIASTWRAARRRILASARRIFPISIVNAHEFFSLHYRTSRFVSNTNTLFSTNTT